MAATALSWVPNGLALAAGGSWAQIGVELGYAVGVPLAWAAASGWHTLAGYGAAGIGIALRAVWVAGHALVGDARAGVGIQRCGCEGACRLSVRRSMPPVRAVGMGQGAASPEECAFPAPVPPSTKHMKSQCNKSNDQKQYAGILVHLAT